MNERKKKIVDGIMDNLTVKTKDKISANIGNVTNDEIRLKYGIDCPGSLRLALIRWRQARGIKKIVKNREVS